MFAATLRANECFADKLSANSVSIATNHLHKVPATTPLAPIRPCPSPAFRPHCSPLHVPGGPLASGMPRPRPAAAAKRPRGPGPPLPADRGPAESGRRNTWPAGSLPPRRPGLAGAAGPRGPQRGPPRPSPPAPRPPGPLPRSPRSRQRGGRSTAWAWRRAPYPELEAQVALMDWMRRRLARSRSTCRVFASGLASSATAVLASASAIAATPLASEEQVPRGVRREVYFTSARQLPPRGLRSLRAPSADAAPSAAPPAPPRALQCSDSEHLSYVCGTSLEIISFLGILPRTSWSERAAPARDQGRMWGC